jgi:hypothetical protein
MAEGVRADDYLKLQKALKDVDKKAARVYRKRLREAAGPLGRLVLEYGVAKMPSSGGLRAYLLGHSPISVAPRSTGVDLWLGSKKKSQLSRINNAGVVRHPVFADAKRTRKFVKQETITRGKNKGKSRNVTNTVRQWAWADTKVPQGAFDEALKHLAPEAAQRLSTVMTDILKELDLP